MNNQPLKIAVFDVDAEGQPRCAHCLRPVTDLREALSLHSECENADRLRQERLQRWVKSQLKPSEAPAPGYSWYRDQRGGPELPIAQSTRCVRMPPGDFGDRSVAPQLVERKVGSETVLLTDEDPTLAIRFQGEVITVGDLEPGETAYAPYFGARVWDQLRVTAVGPRLPPKA